MLVAFHPFFLLLLSNNIFEKGFLFLRRKRAWIGAVTISRKSFSQMTISQAGQGPVQGHV
jgi:hypothetical protein